MVRLPLEEDQLRPTLEESRESGLRSRTLARVPSYSFLEFRRDEDRAVRAYNRERHHLSVHLSDEAHGLSSLAYGLLSSAALQASGKFELPFAADGERNRDRATDADPVEDSTIRRYGQRLLGSSPHTLSEQSRFFGGTFSANGSATRQAQQRDRSQNSSTHTTSVSLLPASPARILKSLRAESLLGSISVMPATARSQALETK